nr:AAA family ATPase [Bosea lathyri]
MQAGVGVKTGQGLVLIDADTKNEAHARIIKDEIERRFGSLPVRIGQYPKAGYLVRTDADFTYTRIEFGLRDDKGRLLDRVEILADGRQFVSCGIHPATGQAYRWPDGMPAYADLPYVAGPDLSALLKALTELLPSATAPTTEGGGNEYDQRSLAGDLATVTKAVSALPNTTALFPTRESYRDVGYAIRAALPDNQAAGLELFQQWAAKWDDGEGGNDPDVVAADWHRMKPPYRRGASWLYELAEDHSRGTFSVAERWLEEPGSDTPLFPENLPNAFGNSASLIEATPYGFPDPAKIPKRQWLYDNHYIRKFVSATVAPSGVGKSSLKIVEALAMASGKPLLGAQPTGTYRVWLWNGEDPMDELERRISAAMQHYGLTREDVGDRLFVDSGRNMEIVLASETRDGCRIAEPVAGAVLATIEANRLDVLTLDPFISTHRVSENDNGAIDMVVKKWAKIADAGNASVELVHHVRKLNGGEVTVEDGRGAVSLLAAARSARALSRMSKVDAVRMGLVDVHKRLFHFADDKNNLAPPAPADGGQWFELASVALGNGLTLDAGGMAGPEGADALTAIMSGDSVGVVRRYVLEARTHAVAADDKASTLALVRAGEWRRDPRAGDAWIGVPIAQGLGLDLFEEEAKGRVKSIVAQWIKDGILKEITKNDAQRRPRTFVEVVENSGIQNLEDGLSVFD